MENSATPACALRNVRISVPEAVRRGETARLSCDYDLEMAPLYSIKWYRGDEEFYRYVPKEAPPTQVFPLAGISVDVLLYGSSCLTIAVVHRLLPGKTTYMCKKIRAP
ncbi:hypothetical protein J437_LFUL000644 [Ladona fulva]|uniref:Ig-like domain-containing protein n=1 Tax=Ladona fulva TaxID=123851 RepID=A0A8K0K1F6_LADFU|nr:hypothetical protein J437_LFUL000644 [Ladona fulva]